MRRRACWLRWASVSIRWQAGSGRLARPPSARVLESVDAGEFDAAVTSWLASAATCSGRGTVARAARWPWTARPCAAPVTPPVTGRPRTCWPPSTSRPGPSWRKGPVDGKTNEITQFAPLLAPLDLAGCVITADALGEWPGGISPPAQPREHGQARQVAAAGDGVPVATGQQPRHHRDVQLTGQ